MNPSKKINKQFVDELQFLPTRYPNEDYEYENKEDEVQELNFEVNT